MKTDKGIPKVTVQDGKTLRELGKELNAAHDLLCALREVGGTRKDLRAICEMRDDLQALIYRARGISLQEDGTQMLMNLDADPGITPGYSNSREIIIDKRLGMWVMELNNPEGLIIGDKEIVFEQPEDGECMISGVYDRSSLGYDASYFSDLNAQAAAALLQNPSVTQNIFSGLSEGDEWKDEKIFFLGTIWKQRATKKGNSGANHGWDICAKALVCNREGQIALFDEPLPVGKWPKNYFIAILANR